MAWMDWDGDGDNDFMDDYFEFEETTSRDHSDIYSDLDSYDSSDTYSDLDSYDSSDTYSDLDSYGSSDTYSDLVSYGSSGSSKRYTGSKSHDWTEEYKHHKCVQDYIKKRAEAEGQDKASEAHTPETSDSIRSYRDERTSTPEALFCTFAGLIEVLLVFVLLDIEVEGLALIAMFFLWTVFMFLTYALVEYIKRQ